MNSKLLGTNIAEQLDEHENKLRVAIKAKEMGLYSIGTFIRCHCHGDICGVEGTVTDYNFSHNSYEIVRQYGNMDTIGFNYARCVSKLEKALK